LSRQGGRLRILGFVGDNELVKRPLGESSPPGVTTTTPFDHTAHWAINHQPFLKGRQLDSIQKLSAELGTPRGERSVSTEAIVPKETAPIGSRYISSSSSRGRLESFSLATSGVFALRQQVVPIRDLIAQPTRVRVSACKSM